MIEPELTNEIEIIHLIYTKYLAQQRGQRWWKYFAILHRRLLRFVQNNKVDEPSATFIVRKLAPQAARAFHAVLAQGAFITLGFAMIAALARIRSLLVPYVETIQKPSRHGEKSSQAKSIALSNNMSIPSIDEDIGEPLDDNIKPSTKKVKKHSTTSSSSSSKSKKSSKHSSKKSKKSKHSEIDDIFG